MTEIATAAFWWGLAAVVWVNVILSCDNAVVIALAARSLPPRERRRAVAWGAGAAIALRIALTLVAVEVLRLPFLKIGGGLVLLWIAVRLMVPDGGEPGVRLEGRLVPAIRTIVVADLMMSVDNVIAVAAAAHGSVLRVVLGLAVSVPLVIAGAALLLKLIERYPLIVVLGAGILGWVAGGMLVTDPASEQWVSAKLPSLHIDWLGASWAEIAGAAFVIAAGGWRAIRAEHV
jgi:YjbE family integral membrane protein